MSAREVGGGGFHSCLISVILITKLFNEYCAKGFLIVLNY